MEHKRSVNAFKNEFSHIAVEVPSVNPLFKAVSTLGIASNVLWYIERSFCVHFAFSSDFLCGNELFSNNILHLNDGRPC